MPKDVRLKNIIIAVIVVFAIVFAGYYFFMPKKEVIIMTPSRVSASPESRVALQLFKALQTIFVD